MLCSIQLSATGLLVIYPVHVKWLKCCKELLAANSRKGAGKGGGGDVNHSCQFMSTAEGYKQRVLVVADCCVVSMTLVEGNMSCSRPGACTLCKETLAHVCMYVHARTAWHKIVLLCELRLHPRPHGLINFLLYPTDVPEQPLGCCCWTRLAKPLITALVTVVLFSSRQ